MSPTLDRNKSDRIAAFSIKPYQRQHKKHVSNNILRGLFNCCRCPSPTSNDSLTKNHNDDHTPTTPSTLDHIYGISTPSFITDDKTLSSVTSKSSVNTQLLLSPMFTAPSAPLDPIPETQPSSFSIRSIFGFSRPQTRQNTSSTTHSRHLSGRGGHFVLDSGFDFQNDYEDESCPPPSPPLSPTIHTKEFIIPPSLSGMMNSPIIARVICGPLSQHTPGAQPSLPESSSVAQNFPHMTHIPSQRATNLSSTSDLVLFDICQRDYILRGNREANGTTTPLIPSREARAVSFQAASTDPYDARTVAAASRRQLDVINSPGFTFPPLMLSGHLDLILGFPSEPLDTYVLQPQLHDDRSGDASRAGSHAGSHNRQLSDDIFNLAAACVSVREPVGVGKKKWQALRGAVMAISQMKKAKASKEELDRLLAQIKPPSSNISLHFPEPQLFETVNENPLNNQNHSTNANGNVIFVFHPNTANGSPMLAEPNPFSESHEHNTTASNCSFEVIDTTSNELSIANSLMINNSNLLNSSHYVSGSDQFSFDHFRNNHNNLNINTSNIAQQQQIIKDENLIYDCHNISENQTLNSAPLNMAPLIKISQSNSPFMSPAMSPLVSPLTVSKWHWNHPTDSSVEGLRRYWRRRLFAAEVQMAQSFLRLNRVPESERFLMETDDFLVSPRFLRVDTITERKNTTIEIIDTS